MGEEKVLVNVHESYRWVVGVCDEDIYGRKLKDGKRQLDLTGPFFKGKAMSFDEARDEIVRCAREDATFNFAGKNSVRIAREVGAVKDEGIVEIEGVPFALALL